ncbi:MAG: penicillin-binding transpeptidase domain-containing protein, partial [Myxococcales bacterium]
MAVVLVTAVALLGVRAFAGDASEAAAPAAAAPAVAMQAAPGTPAPAVAADEAALESLTELDGESEVDDERPVAREPLPGRQTPTSAKLPDYARLPALGRAAELVAQAQQEPDGRLSVQTPEGKRYLTIDPTLQRRLTELLKLYKIPYGAVAAIEPSTGRVLALAEHSEERPGLRGLNLRAIYPAASLFKIVTGAALLDAGIGADEKVCYHGGKRRLQPKLLKDSKRDYRCMSLSDAMAHSANVVFAKLAVRSLDAARLRAWAERFHFNAPLPFAQPVEPSPAVIPQEEFDFARTAAGFGEVLMSPLHAAWVSAAVGNRGVGRLPVLFEDERAPARQVVDAPTAAQLADMLEGSVTEGTARRAFHERGRYVLGEVAAAGKTGSLADYQD